MKGKQFTASRKLWEFKAVLYDRLRSGPIIKSIYQEELRSLQSLFPSEPAQFHLDLGCGTGSSFSLYTHSTHLFLADVSMRMLHLARRKRPAAHAICLDAGVPLPFKTGSFDLITAIGLVEYIADVSHLLRELWRVAKPAAWLVVTASPANVLTVLRIFTGSRPKPHNPETFQLRLIQTGWTVCKQQTTPMQLQWLCRKPGE